MSTLQNWPFVSNDTDATVITRRPAPRPLTPVPVGKYTFWVLVEWELNSEALPCETLARADRKKAEYAANGAKSVHIRVRRASSPPPAAQK